MWSAIGLIFARFFRALDSLIPSREYVEYEDRIVREWRGRDPELVVPKGKVYWWLRWNGPLTSVKWVRKRQDFELLVEDASGLTRLVKGYVAYEICDPVKWVTENEDPGECVDEIAAGVVFDALFGESQTKLVVKDFNRKQPLDEINDRLEDIGAFADTVRITSCGRCRAFYNAATVVTDDEEDEEE